MALIETVPEMATARSAGPQVDQIVASIDALAAADRHGEALALASDHATRLDNPTLWSRLGTLRMAAVHEVVACSAARGIWPPELPDPFPDVIGIPEIDAADLDWRLVGGAVLHHGSLLVRGMLDGDTAARLRNGIDEALKSYDAWHAGNAGQIDSGDYSLLALPEGEPIADTRPWSRESGGVWAVEAPRLFQTVLNIYRDRGLLDAIAGYLGEQPMLSVGKTVFRRAEPDGHGLFHQDGAFMGAEIRTLNLWTALSDCGEDAPGLEVVARRIDRIVETGTPGAIFDWAVARDEAERAANGAPIIFPKFRAGDSLIFDQFMLHATGIKAGMIKRRYALESWFFAPSSHPADQIPIII